MRILILTAALLLAACGGDTDTVAKTPAIRIKVLDKGITQLADRIDGRLEVAVQNLDGGEIWARNAEQTFPLQSVFKAPLGAAVLSEVDAGRLSLNEAITIEDMELSPPLSPISQAWPGRTTYTVRELLVAAVRDSDNTAADVLMRKIGGPGALKSWLVEKGIIGLRIDRYERELQVEAVGMPSFRPAWRTPEAFEAARLAVPEADRRAAWAAYAEDPRDTTTASGSLNFLCQLSAGQLVSPASTALLLKLMTETKTGQNRLKAGLPEGATLAHKTGTSGTNFGVTAATNDIGILTLKDGRKYAVVVLLADSPADLKTRERVLATAMRVIGEAVE
ncbi:MAG: class A beta-lactamase [Caulobacter sp.]|nr:class A beta-lactamase [Caulobacter sp.]